MCIPRFKKVKKFDIGIIFTARCKPKLTNKHTRMAISLSTSIGIFKWKPDANNVNAKARKM